jgi:hypothetical protein
VERERVSENIAIAILSMLVGLGVVVSVAAERIHQELQRIRAALESMELREFLAEFKRREDEYFKNRNKVLSEPSRDLTKPEKPAL